MSTAQQFVGAVAAPRPPGSGGARYDGIVAEPRRPWPDPQSDALLWRQNAPDRRCRGKHAHAVLIRSRLARWPAVALLLAYAPVFAADDDVMRAMRDELARSMRKLQLENLDKPYFVAYRVVESKYCGVAASFGALTQSGSCEVSGQRRSRGLNVEVRVGDYNRDNTNFSAT